MSTETLSLPCTPVRDGKPTMLDFTGERVGKFFIHRDAPDRWLVGYEPWSVTHLATGLAIQKRINTKEAALRMASKLAELDCWDFSDAEQAKSIPADVMARINEIRRAA